MENTLNGLQKITSRILSDASQNAEEIMDAAKKTAEDYREKAMAEAEKKAEAILTKARENAAVIAENAEAGVLSQARSETLHLKNESVNKALAAAKARFSALEGDARMKAYAKLLADAVNTCLSDGMDAVMLVCEKDEPIAAEAVKTAAITRNVKVTAETAKLPFETGFIVKSGDIEVNCGDAALFADLDADLKKEVLALLFEA